MTTRKILRSITIAIFTAITAAGWLGTSHAQQPETGLAVVVQVKGVLNSAKAQMIDRTIQAAEDRSARLIIIEIDSPGGILKPTNRVITAMLESQVPTILYVSPQGAQAGAAGTLLATAADFTAMAPDSTIGSAASTRGQPPRPEPARTT